MTWKVILKFIIDYWPIIGAIVYEIAARVWPTKWNISLLDNIMKILNAVIANKRIPNADDKIAPETKYDTNVKNIIKVKINRHIISMLFIFLSFSASAQIWQNFKGIRLVNNRDTTNQLAIDGSIFYDDDDEVFYAHINGRWEIFGQGTEIDSTNFWRTKSDFTIFGDRVATHEGILQFTGPELQLSSGIIFANPTTLTIRSSTFDAVMTDNVILTSEDQDVTIGAENQDLNLSAGNSVNVTTNGNTFNFNINSAILRGGGGDFFTQIESRALSPTDDYAAMAVSHNAGDNTASISWVSDDGVTEFMSFVIGNQGGVKSAYFDDQRLVGRTGLEYAADYSASFVNESLITKRYADTKIDGTMVAGRIPFGVDANTLTTSQDLTFDDALNRLSVNSGANITAIHPATLNVTDGVDQTFYAIASIDASSDFTINTRDGNLILQPETEIFIDCNGSNRIEADDDILLFGDGTNSMNIQGAHTNATLSIKGGQVNGGGVGSTLALEGGNGVSGGQVIIRGGTGSGDTGGDVSINVGEGSGAIAGNIVLQTVNAGDRGLLRMPSNSGTSTLVGGTVTVAYTAIAANSKIIYSRHTTGGTVGHLSVTVIAGTSFTINSSSGTETSTIDWIIIDP